MDTKLNKVHFSYSKEFSDEKQIENDKLTDFETAEGTDDFEDIDDEDLYGSYDSDEEETDDDISSENFESSEEDI